MKKKIAYNFAYFLALCLFCGSVVYQMKAILEIRETITPFIGLSYVFPADLTYMVVGIFLVLENTTGRKAYIWVRTALRLVAAGLFLWEMLALPLFGKDTFLNEWGFIMPMASLAASYLAGISLLDIILGIIKAVRNKLMGEAETECSEGIIDGK